MSQPPGSAVAKGVELPNRERENARRFSASPSPPAQMQLLEVPGPKLSKDTAASLISLLQAGPNYSKNSAEPPSKRRKVDAITSVTKQGDEDDSVRMQVDAPTKVEHVVVRQSRLRFVCAGTKLSNLSQPVRGENIHLSYATNKGSGHQSTINISVHGDGKNPVFSSDLPDPSLDIAFALKGLKSKERKKDESVLWTDSEMIVGHSNGSDFVELVLTLKWNITTSIFTIPSPPTGGAGYRTAVNPKEVLAAYFPDLSISTTKTKSAQEFYKNVHSPSKDDQVPPTIHVDGLETSLFPFQKRAIQWLLRREGAEWSKDEGKVQDFVSPDEEAPLSFIKVVDAFGRPFYASHLYRIVTLDPVPFMMKERSLRGGILAEEMGLGKTVEIIALMLLHKRPEEPAQVFDPYSYEYVRPTSATLIVSPPTILQQWISEIKRHAPQLNVVHYEGINIGDDNERVVNTLASADVVISTYAVLGDELYYTKINPTKQLRNPPKYVRPKSPLMQLSWWRVCIDEAQMIENGVSNAARVAALIPRINAWCVTGTPVRKDITDLLGLLIFLRFQPFASNSRFWQFMMSSHMQEFRTVFSTLAIRHSKQSVRDELKLPPQHRYVITMPFTPVEEQYYQGLFTQMCEDLDVNLDGSPLLDDWNLDDNLEKMRSWLIRLRKVISHPEVNRSGRRLGNNDAPLRTVDQVLDAMVEQTEHDIRTDQRSILLSQLKRGQLYENSPRVKESLKIWEAAAEVAAEVVQQCREQLSIELAISNGEQKSDSHDDDSIDDDSDSSDSPDGPSSRIGVCRNQLRAALEVQHIAIFFIANAHFQIKSNEEWTKPDSEEFKALEKLEINGYDEAKKLRREILQESYRKATRLMHRIAKRAESQSFVEIPEFPTTPPIGGLESRRIGERVDTLAAVLDAQANVIDEWREVTIRLLLRPLVDEDDEVEITGDEYEQSTRTQDEVVVYIQALGATIADRQEALSGQENMRVGQEVRTTLQLANQGEGAFPEKILELLRERQELKPGRELGSMRGIISELRALITSLRVDAEAGSTRASAEIAIAENQLKLSQKQLATQNKAALALEKELDSFRTVMNIRLEFYRQLQQVSDTVALYEGPKNETVANKMVTEEAKLERKLATSKSKHRYLLHLKNQDVAPDEQRICVICSEEFEIGALTVCGHQFCKACIKLWFHSHRNCPVCKRHLIRADLHDITYKPQVLSVESEELHEAAQEQFQHSPSSKESAIYKQIGKKELTEIKSVELDGPSFTTKIDTLTRHLIWLRDSDPGAKSIIFSQFQDFLVILARAFDTYRIGYSFVDKPQGIEKFKADPSVECLLLHAKAHSSGLTLVNANHVFLCEPLLNTALELQAIARVDRIGQQQKTNVWLYLVDGTVEESIHQLSVRRRMEHIGKTTKGKGKGKGKGKSRDVVEDVLLDSKLEEANSMELQAAQYSNIFEKGAHGGGEMVAEADLLECLFGNSGTRNKDRVLATEALRSDPEIQRELLASAAEERTRSG